MRGIGVNGAVWLITNVDTGNIVAMRTQHIRFVHEYCKDFKGRRSAIAAGYSEKTAASIASELLNRPDVKSAIAERVEDLGIAAGVTIEGVLRRWWDIANADPSELIQMRLINCRYCYGYDHNYQWTEGEYVRAVDAAITGDNEAPSGMGGFGYDCNATPNPECPECGGNGIEHVHIADTRTLTGSARKLFAGIQYGKQGVKVLMRDQDAALLNISKYLGMAIDRKELSGPGGGPIPLASLRAEDLTDDQLAAILLGPAVDDDVANDDDTTDD